MNDKEIIVEVPNEETASQNNDAMDAVEELKSQLDQMNDKYLRALAELENTRRRAVMDANSAGRARAISVAENFLPLIDAIGVALGHDPENKDFISFMMAADGALESAGIKKISSIGQPLNPMLHNAIQTEQSDEPSGTIINELQSGYTFGDAILRPAMVIIAK